jgi:hypothetical protein
MSTWREAISELNTGKSDGTAAVNKPLLLLFIISAAARGDLNRFRFCDCEKSLREAQRRFGARSE